MSAVPCSPGETHSPPLTFPPALDAEHDTIQNRMEYDILWSVGWALLAASPPSSSCTPSPLTGRVECEAGKALTLCKCGSVILTTSLCYQHKCVSSTNPKQISMLASVKEFYSVLDKMSIYVEQNEYICRGLWPKKPLPIVQLFLLPRTSPFGRTDWSHLLGLDDIKCFKVNAKVLQKIYQLPLFFSQKIFSGASWKMYTCWLACKKNIWLYCNSVK